MQAHGKRAVTSSGLSRANMKSYIGGLAYVKMRRYTEKEYDKLPHVIMTSDKEWDPSIFDRDVDPNDPALMGEMTDNLHQLPHTRTMIYRANISETRWIRNSANIRRETTFNSTNTLK